MECNRLTVLHPPPPPPFVASEASLVFVQLRQMFILLFLGSIEQARESSKSKRVLETETATIYLSLRSLISDSVDCTKHSVVLYSELSQALYRRKVLGKSGYKKF